MTPEGVERWNLEASNPLAIADAIIKYLNDAEVWGEDTPQVTVLVEKSVVGQMLMSALRQRGIEAEYRGDSARFYTKLEVRDVATRASTTTDPAAKDDDEDENNEANSGRLTLYSSIHETARRHEALVLTFADGAVDVTTRGVPLQGKLL